MATGKPATVAVENFLRMGKARQVNADMYQAMRQAYLKVVPAKAPGLTVAEIQQRLLAHLPERLFPGGAKAGWWAKTVQLDLEAKGLLARERTTPLRLHKTAR